MRPGVALAAVVATLSTSFWVGLGLLLLGASEDTSQWVGLIYGVVGYAAFYKLFDRLLSDSQRIR